MDVKIMISQKSEKYDEYSFKDTFEMQVSTNIYENNLVSYLTFGAALR